MAGEKKTCSDHVTRNASTGRNNAAQGLGKNNNLVSSVSLSVPCLQEERPWEPGCMTGSEEQKILTVCIHDVFTIEVWKMKDKKDIKQQF